MSAIHTQSATSYEIPSSGRLTAIQMTSPSPVMAM